MASSLRNRLHINRNSPGSGFALPTILIASVVMLTVLLVSVTSATAIRTAMFNQYYSQLAQAAGEAGVEYAKACLQANGNVPAWTNAKPLMPNTDCSGNVQAGYSAYVMTSGNVRSGFSLSLPGLDADGKAKTIPNSGYVEIVRTSNGEVWRRYNQPSVQAAVVPDLCSGVATSSLGWSNATVRTSSYGPAAADPISISTSNIKPGPMYFRKDFSIIENTSYTFSIYANDVAEVFIDGGLLVRYDRGISGTSTVNVPATLSGGCHTLIVKLTNNEILDNSSVLVASLGKDGDSAPIVVTDSSWRVAAGLQKHYSEVDYYADPASWTPVRDLQSMGTPGSTWPAISGDSDTRYISTSHSYDGSGNYPAGFTLFRDNRVITLSQVATARITVYCDDACYPYIDGNLVHQGISLASGYTSFTQTLAEGSHKFAFLASNGGGAAGYALTAVDTTTGKLITHTDTNWSAAYFWSTANPTSSYSYDNSYKPNPNPIPEANVSVLAVGGGGGGGSFGGGGGGGGFVYDNAYTIGVGSYSVAVGAGGSGATTSNSGIPGNNGSSSVFDKLIAVGGGGGGTRKSDYTSGYGASGGSGGGSSMGNTGTIAPGGISVLGQGMAGGLGRTPNNPHLHGGGGGAGAVGGNAVAPNAGAGGAGLASTILTGAPVYYAGGGGGGTYIDGTYVVGPGGAGGGGAGQSVVGANGGAGTPNTGGGGGGGGYTGVGGAGGSGVVIIRYPSASMTATGGTITTITVGTVEYKVHKFTSSGTFTVISIQ